MAVSVLPGFDILRQLGRGSKDVLIAVIDGPTDLSHPCFQGAQLREGCAPAVGSLCDKARTHGTQVASILFGQPNSLMPGLVPECPGLLFPIMYPYAEAGDSVGCGETELAAGILRSVEQGARIINVSGGRRSESAAANAHLRQALEHSNRSGAVIVAAAGNDGCACVAIPGALSGVLAVGAMDDEGAPARFSNWGSAYMHQGLLAPGVDVPAAVPGGGVGACNGTSFATAIVTGVIAMLVSVAWRERRFTPSEVRHALLASALPCRITSESERPRCLAGRINIPGALQLLGFELEHSGNSGDEASNKRAYLMGPTTVSGDTLAEATLVSAMTEETKPKRFASNERDAPVAAQSVTGAGCACACSTAPELVYVIGELEIDFTSEARRDSFVQQGIRDPDDAAALVTHLNDHPHHAVAVTWVLVQDATPVYAVQPDGPFAAVAYERLRRFLSYQIESEVERVSIAGIIAGTTRLMNGQTLPVVVPDTRGMWSWNTAALIREVVGSEPEPDESQADYDHRLSETTNFPERVYYEIRNLGITAADRAINFAATNAFQVGLAFRSSIESGMKLEDIGVEPSPICRPGSDCWDVRLTFFDPKRRLEQAKRVHRFTVDVSDVVPVTVGKPRQWDVY
jgi:cyanobactin maturation PatA/PatG family protease